MRLPVAGSIVVEPVMPWCALTCRNAESTFDGTQLPVA